MNKKNLKAFRTFLIGEVKEEKDLSDLPEEEFFKELNKYINKIEDNTLEVEDVPNMMKICAYPDIYSKGKVAGEIFSFRHKLIALFEKVTSIIAEYYDCNIDEICLGDYIPKENETVCPYTVILGDARFNHLITDLGKLRFIGGNADFRCSNIKSLNQLEFIKGNTNFQNCNVEDFSSLKIVGGSLCISDNRHATTLTQLEVIGGETYFYNCKVNFENLIETGFTIVFNGCIIESLGSLKAINGDAIFKNSTIHDLGSLEYVKGDFVLNDDMTCEYFKELKRVDGNLELQGSNIKSLGFLEVIGGDISFEGTEIVDLGGLIKIGGNAGFINCKVKDLGYLREVGLTCYFGNSNINSLGRLRKVGTNLSIFDESIEDLGDLEEVGEDLLIYEGSIKTLGNLKTVGRLFIKSGNVEDIGALQCIKDDYFVGPSFLREQCNKQKILTK